MSSGPSVRSVADKTSSAVELVTAEIRRAILTGSLPPGEQFSIRDLAKQLGVSHIPIRESLRRLEGQGLIILKPARSAEVAPLTTADMEAIYSLRLRIEPAIAAESVALHSKAQLARLAYLLEEIRNEDPDLAWQAHHDFHFALVAPGATEWDLRLLDTLWAAADRYTRLVFDPTMIDATERNRRYELHAALLRNVLDQDRTGMQAELTNHLSANEDRLRLQIGFVEAASQHA